MSRKNSSRPTSTCSERYRSLLIVAVIAILTTTEFDGGHYGSLLYGQMTGTDYTSGFEAGYDDGYAGLVPADTSAESSDYQAGYSDGYAMGEMDANPANSGNGQADYNAGFEAGYDDGYAGLVPADTSAESSDYQAGYSDGYAMGEMDAAMIP